MANINSVMLERRSLITIFNELRNYHVIAVCAPAGYGKTVAVTQWLNKDTRAKAIFTADEYDNYIAGFCERFCATLIACQPQNQTLNEIVSHHFFQGAPEEFTLRAVSALSSRKQTILTLDDLHLVHDTAVLKLINVIIKRLPKNFQVVWVSRHELPPSLSDLWLKGQVAKVNAEQFLFKSEEIMALYKKWGNQITREQANDIEQQTNGWAIGINAFMLSGGKPSDKAYDYLNEFVQTNIWEKWDDTTRNFMLHTTFLRELTPSLCEVMTGISCSDKVLEKLAHRGAFVVKSQDGVYHYHDLFHQLLTHIAHERGDEFMFSLLEKEGNWHLSQMDFISAFDCFIRCKNHKGIDKCYYLLDLHGHKSIMVERLLPILKHPEFLCAAKKYPRLLYLLIYCALIEGRKEDMISFMDEYYARHSEIATSIPNLAHQIHHIREFDFRIQQSRIIMEMKVPDDVSNIIVTHWRASTNLPFLHRGLVDISDLAIGDVVENITNSLSKTSWLYGGGIHVNKGTLIAGLLYEQGHVSKAHEYILKAYAQVDNQSFFESKFWPMLMLINILDSLEETDTATAVQQSIERMIEEKRAYHLYYNFNAFVARRKFETGDVKAAEEWLSANTFDTLFLWEIYTAFTTCRALIITRKFELAIILLNKVLEIASAFNRPLDIIESRILLAIAYWKKKHRLQNKAIEHLESAVIVAFPYGFTQMFVFDGAELTGMLNRLHNQVAQRSVEDKKHLSFIKMLYLQTCNSHSSKLKSEYTEAPMKFTDKQKTIMNLLCKGKSYKEISEALGIKQPSLRNHLALIYKKLGVASMADAVSKIGTMESLE